MKAEVSKVSRKALWRFYEQNQSESSRAKPSNLRTGVKEGVFGHFELVHSIRVSDRFRAEADVHRRLAIDSPRHKEFFKAPHHTVTAVMDSVLEAEKRLLSELGLDPISSS